MDRPKELPTRLSACNYDAEVSLDNSEHNAAAMEKYANHLEAERDKYREVFKGLWFYLDNHLEDNEAFQRKKELVFKYRPLYKEACALQPSEKGGEDE